MSQEVYFARCGDKIKIGCSLRPEVRIAQVGEWLPEPIELLATTPGNFTMESTIHATFDAEWSHGEWFHASPRLLAFVEKVKRGEPLPIDAQKATARATMIAEKKRLTRKLGQLGVSIPDNVLAAMYSPEAKGRPYPDWVIKELEALIADASPARPTPSKAAASRAEVRV